MSSVDIDELVAAYVAGETLTALASRFGVHRVTVSRYVELSGKARPLPVPISPEQVLEAGELYQQGLTLKEVAAQLGFTSETIRKHLHRSGVRLRPKGVR